MPLDAWRPHMARRAGETAEAHRARLAHSCYACGAQYQDLAVLRLHEDTHTANKGSGSKRALPAT